MKMFLIGALAAPLIYTIVVGILWYVFCAVLRLCDHVRWIRLRKSLESRVKIV